MKLPLLIAVLLTAVNSFANNEAYLDIEDDQIVSIFEKPGYNWKTCQNDPACRSIGWPDNKSKIKVLSPVQKKQVEDPYTGKMVVEDYVFVEFSYERTVNGRVWKKEGKGWIDASYLSKEKHNTFYGDDCPDTSRSRSCSLTSSSSNEIATQLQRLQPVTTATNNQSVKEVAKALNGAVGQCVINPANPPTRFAAGNPFDTLVLPAIARKATRVLGPDGQPVTLQEMADIDALARTLYGEMAGCFKHGLQYPMAVAKIAYNRANAPDKVRKTFVGNNADHSSRKDDLARVVTTPSQFNVWKKYNEDGKVNGSLKLALCPPSDPNKASWQKFKPGKDELAIWENALRIATETVLFSNKFNRRTSEIRDNIYDYNSGPRDPWGYTRIYPRIEGRRVDRVACMQVWRR
ncbi:hypothetical protein [Bdellovibrio sp. HCB337]|uniref:hypothetical protein n=1 Tax=Bdellovibrio sp. HCB337 TaxID=3394358 RepID=UPI0039A4F466